MIDTHAIARSLTEADLTPAQADAITAAIRIAAEHDAAGIDVDTLVTKADLHAEVASLEARLAWRLITAGIAIAAIGVGAAVTLTVTVLRVLG